MANRFYEKIKELKKAGLDDSAIMFRLIDNNTHLTEISKELEDYNKREEDVEWMRNWGKSLKYVDDRNEYGIPMINTDADW